MTDQKPPVNEPSALWRAYTNLVQQGALHGEAIAETLGLDATALRCIGFAWTEPDQTPGRLAELTGLTTGAVTGVLDRLERAGFVQRIPDPADRRRTIVRVSHERGREVGAAYDPVEHAIEGVTERLDPTQRSLLVEVLGSLRTIVAQDTERLRASSRGGMVGSMFTAPTRDVTHGRLTFRSGAPRFALRAAPLGPESEMRAVAELTHTVLRIDGRTEPGELTRASFSGPLPDVRTQRGEVAVAYKRRLDWRQREARIGLLRDLPWTIDVSGGLSTLDADLRSLRVRELSVSGSVDDVRLLLGRPDGTSRIRVSGASRDVVVELPGGVALRLSVSGGAKDIRFEREHMRNAHGQVRLETREAASAADRFELELSGGARSVKVRRA
jgi:DNA-binding MarR family transcriptional regulator